jgi:hypothetical protein
MGRIVFEHNQLLEARVIGKCKSSLRDSFGRFESSSQ